MRSVINFAGIFFACLVVLPAMSAMGEAQQSEAVTADTAYYEIIGDKDKRITIPFELINNLIVIEGSINGSVPLKFILDTGVSKTLVTTIPIGEEIFLESSRIVQLSGLGAGEPIEAFYSEKNQLQIANVVGKDLDMLFLTNDIFQLSSFMGTNVHGIIGYELFADFAVEINYLDKEIILYDPDSFEKKFKKLPRHRKWHKIPLFIEDKKPYVDVTFRHQPGADEIPLRLLIDTGSSNAFSLYDLTHEGITVPRSQISTLIGVGLSGKVSGHMGRIESIKMGDMKFDEPVVAYPDSASIRRVFSLGDRNGSLGGEVLRRFKVIFHYPNQALYVRANKDFGDRFYYNLSGIEVNTPVADLPLYVVSDVREDSPADREGVRKGDVIKFINGEPVTKMSLNELITYLQKRQSRNLILGVQRDSVYKRFKFRLENQLRVDSNIN
ncbi:aspartyl protease family protein [Gracilimonas tropica]|uniref:aspartyl protease family protein n=1 Tax=Gracilimonas tropica TaxID=454600 RepID=UPI0003677588|nr:aspartyl protease family protein [Gracilimonas tropica]